MRFCLRSALARKNAPPRVRVVQILAELAILDKGLGSIPDFLVDSGGRKRLWDSNGDVEVAEGLPDFCASYEKVDEALKTFPVPQTDVQVLEGRHRIRLSIFARVWM